MFNLGFSELILIFIVIIVFIKPDDLPAFFRKIGQLYGQSQQYYRLIVNKGQEFRREIEQMKPTLPVNPNQTTTITATTEQTPASATETHHALPLNTTKAATTKAATTKAATTKAATTKAATTKAATIAEKTPRTKKKEHPKP